MGIRHIYAQSVNDGLSQALHHILGFGLREPTRNGDVLVSRMPVVTTYETPMRRVLVNPTRDANPFFHLFESMWMLAGRNDLAFPQKFVSTFNQFSDDGETLWGAYGYRWRNWFGNDQLEMLAEELIANPSTRRAVLQMWDGNLDLTKAVQGGKDVPCNTAAFFDTIGGKLNMTVTCRSNDIVLGAYGANAVHFSFLLEYMAAITGIPMGEYRQFSNNFHLYTNLYPGLDTASYGNIERLANTVTATCVYSAPGPLRQRDFKKPEARNLVPLMGTDDHQCFHEDLEAFMEFDIDDFESRFFQQVVGPMYRTWAAWKAKDFETADHLSLTIVADDWRLAAQSWLRVREANRNKEKTDA